MAGWNYFIIIIKNKKIQKQQHRALTAVREQSI